MVVQQCNVFNIIGKKGFPCELLEQLPVGVFAKVKNTSQNNVGD